ncbi:MAG: NAD(P)/FAD-dependent oxidoreductase [Microbacteriaceae bacterium]
MPDAVVVGAGPNGLAAAVTLARAGLEVEVLEREATIGGGARTGALTLPGFLHDVCSAVHPMALASEFFQRFGLERRIELAVPQISYAHPLDGARAAIAYRDLERTAEGLGRDGRAWRGFFGPLSERADAVAAFTGDSLLRVPTEPGVAIRFGLRALEQGTPLWNLRFTEDRAPALLSGVAAHSILPLPSFGTAGAALMLGATAHGRGWPVPIGGSQAIVDALAADLLAHGGTIRTGVEVTSLDELPPARAVLLDVTPRALERLAGSRLPEAYRRKLRAYRVGNAAAKVDLALDGPVPWAVPELAQAPTVHLGGSRAQIAAAEHEVARGRHAARPYVLVAQPSVLDPGRAPAGAQALWTYAHVPRGSTVDPTEMVLAQLERFAPGVRDRVIGVAARPAAAMAEENPNYLGGDIANGMPDLRQLLARPVLAREPWRTPARGVYLSSAATPPGPGVHGLAGWRAALSALRHEFGVRESPDLSPR